MFEAFVSLCLLSAVEASGAASSDGTCRVALLPGHAAVSEAACEESVRDRPPSWLTTFAPAEPFCRPRRESRLAFTEIAPGLFVHRGDVAEPDAGNAGDVSNIVFVVGTQGVAVVDAGGSRQVGEEVYLAVRQRTALPISHLILTHMHPDHVFGAEPLREAGAKIVGQQNLPGALADRAESYQASFGRLIGAQVFLGSRIVMPDRMVADMETIDLGSRTIELKAWPTAHTSSDLTVFDRQTATLIAGDLLFDEHAPALDGSLKGWRSVLDALSGIEAVRAVPGHGGPVFGWPAGAKALAHYLEVLETDTRAAVRAGVPLAEASRSIGMSEAQTWVLFDLYNPRNATTAYTELEWE
ncbi:quinoprotein relay system zinc metallohydrolase 2 [Rhizobium puerariae]|uniref:Quinoprotein relay system zinc metallohydrolase 2 n=1 Tax=Rhizobium puerariae TaxID=1585791 RepID=A0ABV6A9Y2_9HYPH